MSLANWDWFYIVPATAAVVGTIIYSRMTKDNEKTVLFIDFVRIFFGAHLIYSGLRFYIGDAQPMHPHPVAGPFMTSLTDMGVFPVIKVMEVIIGLFLLAKRFVPFVLVLEVPTTVIIFYMNVFIVADPRRIFTGSFELLIQGIMMLAYFKYYRSMLVMKADEPILFWKK